MVVFHHEDGENQLDDEEENQHVAAVGNLADAGEIHLFDQWEISFVVVKAVSVGELSVCVKEI